MFNIFHAVSLQKRVAVALWCLATGCSYRTLQELFGSGRFKACHICLERITAVSATLKGMFLRRPNPEGFLEIIQGFRDIWGCPMCAGAIDDMHVPITAPVHHYNRKGWYSVICQAACDHRYRFWDVEVGWPGKGHDARVFSNSSLYEAVEGDNVFPDRT